jgi:hypothetical protein
MMVKVVQVRMMAVVVRVAAIVAVVIPAEAAQMIVVVAEEAVAGAAAPVAEAVIDHKNCGGNTSAVLLDIPSYPIRVLKVLPAVMLFQVLFFS